MSTLPFFPTFPQIVATLPLSTPREVIERLLTADEFAQAMHADKRRISGELYIEHDRAVAYSVSQLGLDTISVIAGLLHDCLLETETDVSKVQRELSRRFGDDVAKLVVGLRDLEPYSTLTGSESARKIERLRRAILNTDDIRVLMVRMADRLQNLLVADKMPEDKRLSIAREANEIYAPIANRLGIWALKSQLEDESFRYLYPDEYAEIHEYVTQHEVDGEAMVQKRIRALQERLAEANLKGEVTGRSKHYFSIYRKMKRKHVPVQEIYDIHALRIILEGSDVGACYQVLGLVHNMWKPIPEEFDDYIANPKPNGYKSLHTAVYDQTGQVLEVQIRTQTMHDDSERGVAAHWVYKEDSVKLSAEFARRVTFMRQLLIDLRDENKDAPTAERMINVDDLSKRIYVFTPQGDVQELPEGSTPVDFAYQVHTQLGHSCRGALVNGKRVQLNHELQQGDVVEIVKGKTQAPLRDWMHESSGYVKSGRTRSKVRQWFRQHDRPLSIQYGREVLERELRLLRPKNLLTLSDLAKQLKEEMEDLLAKVGFGDIQMSQIAGAITLLKEQKRRESQSDELTAAQEEAEVNSMIVAAPRKPQKGLVIQGVAGLHHTFANCCKPIPPEPVMGYITRGRGVSVHSKTCEQFQAQARKEPDRIVEVSWGDTTPNANYEIPLVVRAIRTLDLASNIVTAISGRNIQMVRTKSVTDSKGLTTMYLVVGVQNLEDLNWLKHKLETMSNVIEVQRQR